MRILKSLMLFLTVESGDQGKHPESMKVPVEKTKAHKKSHSFNRLATLNLMMNRLTAFAKGMNPDDNAALAANSNFMNAYRVNNVFFHKTLLGMYNKKDDEGNLKCANHEKIKKSHTRRRRDDDGGVDLSMSYDDYVTMCEMTAEHNDDGECEDCCPTDADGNYIMTNADGTPRAFGLNLDGDVNFIKQARKMFMVVKKWSEMYLGNCNQKKLRYTRIVNLLSRRLFNAMKNDIITMEEVQSGRWKRIFPKKELGIIKDGEDHIMDKSTLLDSVSARWAKYQARQAANQ